MTESKIIADIIIENLQYSIQVPSSVIEKLKVSKHWRGSVIISSAATKKSNNRQNAIRGQVGEKFKFKHVIRATVDERHVVRAWNRSRYIQAQEKRSDREARNYPLPFRKIAAALPLVRKTLREVSLVKIIRNMETYFDFCTAGGHIWEGQSHGFKTLTGFLEKIRTVHKKGERPWWDIRETPTRVVDDEHVRLTNRIANSFAQTFMEEGKFPLIQGSKEHVQFAKAASQMVHYISRKKRQGIELTQTDMIKYLLEFVDELFAQYDDPVYPAHLSSSAVWSALPQFLSEKGII